MLIVLSAAFLVLLFLGSLVSLVVGTVQRTRNATARAKSSAAKALNAGSNRFSPDAPDKPDRKHGQNPNHPSKTVPAPTEMMAQRSFVELPQNRNRIAINSEQETSSERYAKRVGRAIGRAAREIKDHYDGSETERKLRKAAINPENWYEIAYLTCGDTVDALLNQKQGRSVRVINSLAAKLGFAGATAGLFSIASVFGTASTGTAISTLSGAAFNSAALKWLGGGVSMAVGGWVVFFISLIVGAIFYIIARLTFEKHFGRRRKLKRLDAQEKRVVGTLMLIAVGFKKQSEQAIKLNPTSAFALKRDLFDQLVKDLALCSTKVEKWPKRPRDKLAAQIRRVSELRAVLQSTAAAGSQRPDKVSGASQVDIVSIVMLKLMSTPIPNLSEEEERVCTALRKSKGKLKKASNEMLSEYIRLERLSRLKNRLKKVRRIYAKLAKHHGAEGLCEEHTVAFVESPNQSGLEVLTFDERTSTASSFSISSCERAHLLRGQHNELERSEDLAYGENTEDELTELSVPQAWQEAEILENLSLAAVITLARSAGAFLSGQKISKTAKRKMIDQTLHTVGVWGLTDLVT